MQIGSYECLTPFATAGSGTACWCVAQRDGRSVFLKQFLSPALPAESLRGTPLWTMQQRRCEVFEARKRRLYAALGCVLGDCVVPVDDFFAYGGRYYAASEYIGEPRETMETLDTLTMREKRDVLFQFACALGRLHAQGVVHADLKPEHVLLQRQDDGFRVRLIDFDSGFLENEPPENAPEGDPVYLAPEAFLRMTGAASALDRKVDTFAFGAILHRFWTGELPQTGDCQYLYEAALSDADVGFSSELPLPYRLLVQQALQGNPAQRPDDAELVRVLSPPAEPGRLREQPFNGLSRFWKTENF